MGVLGDPPLGVGVVRDEALAETLVLLLVDLVEDGVVLASA
jgi:hypothetical protein